MKTSQFFGWLLIFILGSLIVSFLLSPNSFSNFKSNLETIRPTPNSVSISEAKMNSSLDYVRIVPSEMEKFGLYKDLYKTCAYVESIGESEGISDIKGKECRNFCGQEGYDYYKWACEKADLYVCYCETN